MFELLTADASLMQEDAAAQALREIPQDQSPNVATVAKKYRELLPLIKAFKAEQATYLPSAEK